MTNSSAFLGSPDNPKTAAVVCYITFLGWLIAYFALYKHNKDETAAFHIRQTLLLHILSFLLNGFVVFMSWRVSNLIIMGAGSAVLVVLWIIGLLGAAVGKKKAVPILGDAAQSLFRNL